jgi:murein DD-endopeptidase MepM/ murein hydrolase activator NlpD
LAADANNRRIFEIARATILAMALAAGAGCSAATSRQAPPPASASTAGASAVEHVVRRGETVYHIAHIYGVSVASLMAANHLRDARNLRAGETLTIPGRYSYASLGAADDSQSVLWNVPRAARQFAWPVWSGTVTSGFGMRHGTMHDGIDIAAPIGTPVHAAGSGIVIYVGRLHGYGNTVIIRHTDNYVTVYAHDAANLVSEGQHVTRGQKIARIGTSGRTTGPNLHFEVRYNNLAYNPLSYLPPPGPSAITTSFASNGPS